MKKCKTCSTDIDLLTKKEKKGHSCNSCYVKFKTALKVIKGQVASKFGNWICGQCGRALSLRYNYCWDCGSCKEKGQLIKTVNEMTRV